MTDFVITLIAPPSSKGLSDALVQKLASALAEPADIQWLADQEACDFHLSQTADANIENLKARIVDWQAAFELDVVLQPTKHRKKSLFVADMDSTIIQQECIDELADFAGLKDKIAGITEAAMQGKIDFEGALRERVGLLKGLDVDVLETVIAERIDLTPGARTLVQTMRANGTYCALVSGGFSFFTSRVAKLAGFHSDQANELLSENGRLTGRVREPILGREAKLKALIDFRTRQNLTHHQTLAVGDGANDLAMIKEAGLGVAYHAKPVVAEQAHARVEHGDLTALLYMQGYSKSEFEV